MSQPNLLTQQQNAVAKLFQEHFGAEPEQVIALPVSGSDRRYFRMSGKGASVIGTYNSNVAENNTFFYATQLFTKGKIRVPELITNSKDRKSYLQQDLGDTTLFSSVMKDGFNETTTKLFHDALSQLAQAQWVAGRDADFRQCFGARQFDDKAIMSDLLYFKYYFADLQSVPYNKNALMEELEQLSRDLGHIQPQTLMYRDFQSRNIMLHDNQVYFIDYQGFMQGPPQYDIASLLWQARAEMPEKLKEDLLNGYIATLNNLPVPKVNEIYFRKGYVQFVLIRLLQVLGAYGFKGIMQQKSHFLASIYPALKSLESFIANNPSTPGYPELRGMLERITTDEVKAKYAPKPVPANTGKLKISIFSFSYKKGIPSFGGDHGGGFVFDCRGILNPGRFDDYKHLTGKDEEVKLFLENETTMPEFLKHVTGLVSINVDDYLARGFTNLGVGFGCTGGQHRSVYAAEQLCKFIQDKYGITAELEHLNKENWVKTPVKK